MALNRLNQLLLAFVVTWYMNSLWFSWPEHLLTVVAGHRDSFQMLCLDVVSHLTMLSLFSAIIANIDRHSSDILPRTFCHQRVDLFVELLYVCMFFYNSRNYWPILMRFFSLGCKKQRKWHGRQKFWKKTEKGDIFSEKRTLF